MSPTQPASVIKEIKARGHWRVNVRPSSFEKDRIGSLAEVRSVVSSCTVSFRGWDFPFWDDSLLSNVGEYVECGIMANSIWEYARAYRSGQFVQLSVPPTEFVSHEDLFSNRYPRPPVRAGWVSILDTLFRATEVFEFAARLSAKGVLAKGARISIRLINMDGYQLEWFDPSRNLLRPYGRTSTEPICVERDYSSKELVEEGDRLALAVALKIFEQFNWNHPATNLLAEDQRKLRGRRL